MDAYARYKDLVDEYDSLRPNYHGSMYFMSVISGDKMGRGLPPRLIEKLEAVGGIDTEDTAGNRAKILISRDGKMEPRDKVTDWDIECEVVSKMIVERKAVCDHYAKTVAILKDWAENNVVVISGDAKTKIESLVGELHNEELTRDDHVYRIWDNGLVDTQKGGDIYGMRSVFTHKAGLNVTGLVFPVSYYHGESYAIVCEKDAIGIRDMIIALM